VNRGRSRAVIPGLVLMLAAQSTSMRPTTGQPGPRRGGAVAEPWRGYETVLGRAGALTVLRVDSDDDGAGHSVWPKYLAGRDTKGKTVWQFPRRLLYPGMGVSSEEELRAHFESIDLACLVAECAIVVALGRHQYGLRARDGAVLWRKPRPRVFVISLYPCRTGCFALAIPPVQPGIHNQKDPGRHASLAFVEARTGRWRWLRRVPVADRLVIEDGQLRLYAAEHQVEQFGPAALIHIPSRGFSRPKK